MLQCLDELGRLPPVHQHTAVQSLLSRAPRKRPFQFRRIVTAMTAHSSPDGSKRPELVARIAFLADDGFFKARRALPTVR